MATGLNYRFVESPVSLQDILPDGASIPRILSFHDLIINKSHRSENEYITHKGSFEYDLIVPVDMEKAHRLNVSGLKIAIFNEHDAQELGGQLFAAIESGAIGYTFDANFFNDLSDNINIGELDLKAILEEVKKPRRLPIANNNTVSDFERIDENAAVAGLTDFFQAGSVPGVDAQSMINHLVNNSSETLDNLLGSNIKRRGENFKQGPGYAGFDPILRPPVFVSDGSNLTGESLRSIKEKILIEAQRRGSHEMCSDTGAMISVFESHLAGTISNDGPQYIDYVSSILPVKRRIRLYHEKVSPEYDISIIIRPIIIQEEDQTAASTTGYKSTYALADEVHDLLDPVGDPDMRIIANAPGYIAVEVNTEDPTVLGGVATLTFNNPVYQNLEINSMSKDAYFHGGKAVVEFHGVPNVDPILTTINFHTYHPSRYESYSSISKRIQGHESCLDNIITDKIEKDDGMILSARSLPRGVSVAVEGVTDRAHEVSLMREDLTSATVGRRNHFKVGVLGGTYDESGRSTILDANVTKGRTYRYYLKYKVLSPHKLFESYDDNVSRLRNYGQGVTGTHSRTSVRSVTIKYKKSNKLENVTIAEPAVTQNSSGPAVVEIPIMFQEPSIQYEDIRKILGENFVNTEESKPSVDRKILNMPIPLMIVERLDRVTGEETEVGIAVLTNGLSVFTDNKLFSENPTLKKLTGKYTYKFKLCKPTVGGLQEIDIPLVRPGQVDLEESQKVNALKYTAETFTSNGIIETSEFLSNASYSAMIKSFDTGARFYVNFDPKPPVEGSSPITLMGNRLNNGFKLTWEVKRNKGSDIDSFLVFKTVKGVKQLDGIVKYVDTVRQYTYTDIATFYTVNFMSTMIGASYIVVPLSKRGVYLAASNEYNSNILNDNNVTAIEQVVKALPKFDNSKVVKVIPTHREVFK